MPADAGRLGEADGRPAALRLESARQERWSRFPVRDLAPDSEESTRTPSRCFPSDDPLTELSGGLKPAVARTRKVS